MTGLRERKKERTRRAIRRAALELVAEHGYHETSLPQIAARADVSPRTVSTYFPAKADIVFGGQEEIIERARVRLAERPAAEDPLHAIVVGLLEHDAAHDPEEPRLLHRALTADPALRALQTERLDAAREVLQAALARHLDQPSDALAPRVLAAAALGAVVALDPGFELPGAERAQLAERLVAYLGAGAERLLPEPAPTGGAPAAGATPGTAPTAAPGPRHGGA